jgi:uncharacterized protein YijF (DUF1287 family)
MHGDVCAGVTIRAARYALGPDLQKLMREDMVKNFDANSGCHAWGLRKRCTSIDLRRVLSLDTYWTRAGARL